MVWQQKKKLRFCKVNSYRCLITSYFEILFQYVINFMHINMAMRKEEDDMLEILKPSQTNHAKWQRMFHISNKDKVNAKLGPQGTTVDEAKVVLMLSKSTDISSNHYSTSSPTQHFHFQ